MEAEIFLIIQYATSAMFSVAVGIPKNLYLRIPAMLITAVTLKTFLLHEHVHKSDVWKIL